MKKKSERSRPPDITTALGLSTWRSRCASSWDLSIMTCSTCKSTVQSSTYTSCPAAPSSSSSKLIGSNGADGQRRLSRLELASHV